MWVLYGVVRASAFSGAFFAVPLSTSLLAAPPVVLLALLGPLAAPPVVLLALLGPLAACAALSALQVGRTAPAAGSSGQPPALLTRLLPFTVVPVALWLPLAVVVYLAAGNLFTLVQQALLPAR